MADCVMARQRASPAAVPAEHEEGSALRARACSGEDLRLAGELDGGRQPARRAVEIAALRAGIELGMTLIDTAEMYGDGASEELVGEALAGRRDECSSSARPIRTTPRAAGRRLRAQPARPRDRPARPLPAALARRRAAGRDRRGDGSAEAAGKIRHWGVSNLDRDDMEELAGVAARPAPPNQILYNLTRRGPEFDLLPWLGARGIPVMAYSPVEQGRLLRRRPRRGGARLAPSPPGGALAWSCAAAKPSPFRRPARRRMSGQCRGPRSRPRRRSRPPRRRLPAAQARPAAGHVVTRALGQTFFARPVLEVARDLIGVEFVFAGWAASSSRPRPITPRSRHRTRSAE